MSAILSRPYTPQGRGNWDSIFRKPGDADKDKCTHREETGKFCEKHHGRCGVHKYHEPDGTCSCSPCDPAPYKNT